MRVKCDGDKVKVRLYCIDAPEMGQKPWGRGARDYLRKILPRGADVTVRIHDTDKYGRQVGEMNYADENMNLAMVSAGQAAVYRRFCSDGMYYQSEKTAKKSGAGIWSKSGDHQRPWLWRNK